MLPMLIVLFHPTTRVFSPSSYSFFASLVYCTKRRRASLPFLSFYRPVSWTLMLRFISIDTLAVRCVNETSSHLWFRFARCSNTFLFFFFTFPLCTPYVQVQTFSRFLRKTFNDLFLSTRVSRCRRLVLKFESEECSYVSLDLEIFFFLGSVDGKDC